MITIIIGTNRAGSVSAQVASFVATVYDDLGIENQLLDIAELPPETFSPEAYAEKPARVIEFTDQILAGFHLDDTVYGPLYFDYGGQDEPQGGPRARYARYVEEQFLKRAPETVFVYLKASAKVIAKRMQDESRPYGVLKHDDIDAVLEAFETQAEASLFARKIELDTSDSTPAETLDQLVAQLQPFFTDTDRMRILAHKALAVGGNQ